VWLSSTPVTTLKSRHAISGHDDLIKNRDGALNTLTGKALECANWGARNEAAPLHVAGCPF
jgi:hypothetical protein